MISFVGYPAQLVNDYARMSYLAKNAGSLICERSGTIMGKRKAVKWIVTTCHPDGGYCNGEGTTMRRAIDMSMKKHNELSRKAD